jgi:hypothetical protein
MKIEEYIAKRKKEDGINEYDLDKRLENLRICVNYMFEYFNNYMETRPFDDKTVLHDRKIDYYRKSISDYNTEIREWLVSLYSSYGKYMHKQLMNFITDTYFLLYNTEAEFRALSYDIYPKVVKKFKFLDGQSEMIYQFIKEAHKIRNNINNFSDIYISESINEWVEETYKKYEVNMYNFCYEYIESYYETPEKWPVGHKIKTKYYDEYSKSPYKSYSSLIWDYDIRQKNNLFGLDTLYRNMPKKNFIKGKKQEIEILLMYNWVNWFGGDESNYWDDYIKTVLSIPI